MTTQILNQNRSGEDPDRWPARAPDNRRKASTNTGSNLSGNWARNSRANALRQTASNTYQLDNPRERDLRFRQEKSSDETAEENEPISTDKNNAHEYSENGVRKNVVTSRPGKEARQYGDDCPEFSVPEGMVAVQKLQRLKELQRRRDLTERYYSQEIRRLIGEQYFGPANSALPSFRMNERLHSSNLQPYSGDRFGNVLKICGGQGTTALSEPGTVWHNDNHHST